MSACDPAQDANPPFHFDGGFDSGIVGLPCPVAPADTDGDGISDENEGGLLATPTDTDHDGIPDFRDQDSDNDGIPDVIEARNGNACTLPADSDHDGVADFRDLDSDDANDSTIPDQIEAGAIATKPVDSDGDGKPDYMDADDDADGIPDIVEMTRQGALKAATTLADAPDTDGDGTPDYLDLDSDNDTIADRDEHFTDIDGDLIPNYRDTDSDGDCVEDRFEAGDANLDSPPIDTDGDGAPDFADRDTDNDGLLDGQEDANCSGTLDPCETNRLLADTDGDGTSDLVEYEACAAQTQAVQQQTMCICDGSNDLVSPQSRGEIVFLVPYQVAPFPAIAIASFSTSVYQADVVLTVDTTATMQPAIGNLSLGFSMIASAIAAVTPNIAFGVFQFRDLGAPQDLATTTPPNIASYDYVQRLETVLSHGLSDVQGALGGLVALQGGDGPDGGWGALYTLATQAGRIINVTASTTYSLATNPSMHSISSSETGGTIGGAGFRAGSLPVVVTLTDAEWHDAPGSLQAADSESGLDAYPSTQGPPTNTPACDPCTNVPSRRDAITALQALGAKVIGLAAKGTNTVGDPKTRAQKVAQETGAVVAPADFGPVGTRPSGCPIDQCCTGLDASGNVVGEAAQAGQCPLAFTVDDDGGKAVATSVSAGVSALATALHADVHVQGSDVDPDTVANFVLRTQPNISGQGGASACVTSPPSPLVDNYTGPKSLSGPDGYVDTFPGLKGGQQVCFDVIPKTNKTVPSTSAPQLFRALLQTKGVVGTNGVNLGASRIVYFVVPPTIVNTPLN